MEKLYLKTTVLEQLLVYPYKQVFVPLSCKQALQFAVRAFN